ncbi:MAG: HGGxSTG domain-containing protein [Xanthobacteraceae bacterium]
MRVTVPSRGVGTSLARSTPWRFAGSGGRDSARTRQGRPCRMAVEPGKKRCKFHGGCSTGPRTEAGRARIAAVQRRRWEEFRRSKTP